MAGELSWYTGCAFERNFKDGTIKMSQTAFVEELLKRFENQCPPKTSAIPANPLIELAPRAEDDPGEKWPYREAVGSPQWLANMTRPDIANAVVRVVARHSYNPGEEHWNAVLKILSYLRGMQGRGLMFTRGQGLGVSVYVGADYAKKANDRQSGVAVMCGGVCVCWKSTTQRCATLSTTEAEYIACGDGIKEALFVCGFGVPAAASARQADRCIRRQRGVLTLWLKTPLARPAVSTLTCVITLQGFGNKVR